MPIGVGGYNMSIHGSPKYMTRVACKGLCRELSQCMMGHHIANDLHLRVIR